MTAIKRPDKVELVQSFGLGDPTQDDPLDAVIVMHISTPSSQIHFALDDNRAHALVKALQDSLSKISPAP